MLRVYVFPLEQTQAQLKSAKTDEYGRTRIELDTPAMPTISLFMEKLAAGQRGKLVRTTENQIFAVMSGSGESHVGTEHFTWSRGDVFVAPTWNAVRHKASADAVLFCVSDLPVHQKLGFHRIRIEEH